MKKLALVLSIATLAVAIFAGMMWVKLGDESAQLKALRSQVTEMEGAQAAATATVASANTTAMPAVATPDATGAVPSASPAATPAPASAESIQKGVAKGVADILASDEGRDIIKNQMRAVMAAQFPDLAQELRMTPSEADKFMDLLVKQASESAGDVLGMLGGQSSPEAQRKLLDRTIALEKEISKALGSKYPAWQEYQGTATARQQVDQLRALLGTGPDALSETQSKPLIAALGAEQTRINRVEQEKMNAAARGTQPVNMIEEQLKSMSANNERLGSAASSYLNPTQLDRYRKMLAQQETMLRTIVGGMGGQGGAPR
jgi:hypothetical protein